MGKLLKVKYTSTTTLKVSEEVWDLCERVYGIIIMQDAVPGSDPVEKQREWFTNVYKGGVGRKEAEAIVRKFGLIYLPVIKPGYDFILEELERKGAGKRPKKKDNKRTADYDPEFVDRMCEYYVTNHIKKNPDGSWADYKKKLTKKYSDKKRIQQRLIERAQSAGLIFRTLLKVLEEDNKLPKSAYLRG